MVSLVLLGLCALFSLWHSMHAVRMSEGSDRWAGTVFSGGLGAMVLLYRRDVIGVVDEALGAGVAAVARNLVLISAFAALQFFYLRNVASVEPRNRRRIEVIIIAVVVAVLCVAALSVESPVTLNHSPENLDSPAVLTFFLASNGYLIYACLTQIVWAVRDVPGLARQRGWVLLVTALCLISGCATYMTLLLWRLWHYAIAITAGAEQIPARQPLPGLILIIVSIVTMLLGVSLPIVVADTQRVWRWASATLIHAALRQLDEVVCVLYPDLVRPPAPYDSERLSCSVSDPVGERSLGSTAQELRLQRCSDGYRRAHNVLYGYVPCSRDDVTGLVEIVRKIPGGLPGDGESGQTRQLIRVSRWLEKNRTEVADIIAAANDTNREGSTQAPAGQEGDG